MKWLNEHPKESQVLLDTLTKIVIEYMSAQVENGAHMLQVFEAMGMMIDEPNFKKWCMPSLEAIQKELKKRYPDVPLMVFSRGAWYVHINAATIEASLLFYFFVLFSLIIKTRSWYFEVTQMLT